MPRTWVISGHTYFRAITKRHRDIFFLFLSSAYGLRTLFTRFSSNIWTEKKKSLNFCTYQLVLVLYKYIHCTYTNIFTKLRDPLESTILSHSSNDLIPPIIYIARYIDNRVNPPPLHLSSAHYRALKSQKPQCHNPKAPKNSRIIHTPFHIHTQTQAHVYTHIPTPLLSISFARRAFYYVILSLSLCAQARVLK